ncbi:MAG TPA: hypothetical protein VFR78_04345, partial [Pyrinomonadaceae bacterium]|nr:hypothetical protein [Pyrinomonadaceae bacterium]
GVTVLSVTGKAEPREIARGSYELLDEDPKVRSISLKSTGKNKMFGRAVTSMKIVSFDDSSITCQIPGMGETRWTRVDPDRYFLVLSARTEEFYDHSGSAIQAVIKLAGGVPTIDGFGVYSQNGKLAFGSVPSAAYKELFREARKDSEIVLRLEINSRQYQRALKIIKEWDRRSREGALLYTIASDVSEDPASLNNILVVKAVTETLNQCSEDFDLYKLNYIYPEDWIADRTEPSFIPFVYFKELRRRNEARHIPEQRFQELVQIPNLASR